MKILVLMAAVSLVSLSFLEAKDPWVPFFGGDSVEGWTPRGKVKTFECKEGVVSLLATENVWVVSKETMKNFVVEAEIKLPADAKETGFNSGLAFRLIGETGKPKGYQCEVDLKKPGAVYGVGMGGWLYPKGKDEEKEYAEKIEGVYKEGEFNHYKVEAIDSKIRTWVNGVLISELESDKSLEGMLGIQHHGKGGVVQFRNVRAKVLAH